MINSQIKIIHRRITIIACLPLLITLISGSLYSILQIWGIDAFWLMKIHTGNFFIINLQPFYSPFIGLFTFAALISGVFLFPSSKKNRK